MNDPKFPTDLSGLPEIAAREIYIHQLVRKHPASVFFREFERRKKQEEVQDREEAADVAFRFVDVIYFIAQAAAAGVIGNFTYDRIASLVRAIRKPTRELGGSGVKFELVVSRKTCERLRSKKHAGKRATKGSSVLENELKETYTLMVNPKESLSPRKKQR